MLWFEELMRRLTAKRTIVDLGKNNREQPITERTGTWRYVLDPPLPGGLPRSIMIIPDPRLLPDLVVLTQDGQTVIAKNVGPVKV